MSTAFDFDDRVVLVTGASGALGSGICEAFRGAGATVCATDVVDPDDEDALLDASGIDFYRADFTDEADVERVVEGVVEEHGRLDALCNVAGTWAGGQPLDETPAEEFEMLLDVNLRTTFLGSKHAIPHLRESADGSGEGSADGRQGAIVSVSAKSSLEGGEGDGPYRAAKAGVRLLTETLAAENRGEVRANAIVPKVIDTPANREMMPDADHDSWPTPAEIADVVLSLCSDAAGVTSGAAVPVYGEA
jgi:NAD(P)-dependent dehydrogenase (short-subunit alcohol dehydrogenase family)